MPNYVNCSLCVVGEEKELKKFKEFAKSDENKLGLPIEDSDGNKGVTNVLSSHKFIPYPEKYAKYDRKPKEIPKIEKIDGKRKTIMNYQDGYNSGGYEFCNKFWGSKWGICDAEITQETDKFISYSFQSPWSFPVPLAQKMSKMFPKLEFDFEMDEESFAFIGELFFKAGKIIKDTTHKPTRKELVEKEFVDEEQAEDWWGKNWREEDGN
jgi:hypothetical protein